MDSNETGGLISTNIIWSRVIVRYTTEDSFMLGEYIGTNKTVIHKQLCQDHRRQSDTRNYSSKEAHKSTHIKA